VSIVSRSFPHRSDLKKRFSLAILALLVGVVVMAGSPRIHAQTAPAKVKRKVLVMTEPDYPYILRNGHFDGQVRLEATVLPNGNVVQVECKGGNPMLAQYAKIAVMHWKYAPGPAQTLEEAVFVFKPDVK
jgi:outer membrane biosynthesis protein TonB